MKKLVIAILVVIAFSWVSVVSAENRRGEESPESIVTFSGGGGETISTISVPGTINVVQCGYWEGMPASCIMSLEDQGCKVVDVIVTHYEDYLTMTTYLLSCDGR